MLIDVRGCLAYIERGNSDELFNGGYLTLNNSYVIRVVYEDNDIWYEVDQEPVLEGCYLYTTNSFKDCLDWCNENLNTNIMYY